ncbi:hypothetical protein BMS3Bbin08_02595 [bacterium BMS3Bbin08]|nr:hypothetical protein BMS3Bbin08_02595 [bacterium BMS3Bbin08]
MERIVLSVSSVVCADCSFALRRFIGSLKGINLLLWKVKILS